ncbi:hypothetical protein TSAR_003820 [Trichomalopsis sarcophagae]|uniref:Uncharacterized protein n=1 Tax=Trichomalopsis sarcophagae TaxID=543379 RepID=A0A232FGC4_9HYME|nr:hypothetical protein TSAR_003820 [Trichomalopsis sarcophagae]
MKTFAIVLTLCIVGAYASTLKDDQKAKLREYKESCITETGADKAVIDGIIKGGPINRDEKLDCFSACMLKKIGIMRPDGSIDVESARAKAATTNVDVAKANEVIDKCKDLKGKDTCETGGSVFGCFITNKDFPVLN